MYYEEFNLGDQFTTRPRVVTATEMDSFAISTGAVNPLFLDDKFAKTRGLEKRVAPGLLTLSLAVGLMYALGLFDHIIALLSLNVNFLASVTAGDEIKGRIEVVEKRETKQKDRGIVVLTLNCQNQEGKPVLEVTRFVLLLQRENQSTS
ncbi:MAG: MaoC family dehydratase N-terminal domain-containing protein [Chloroflexi bacterium]|nr:MaoC family dehydratase N-terminal domain-containing protein [Chloroflexota bacterium]